ncbi:MAG: outer membrane beta-barrel protein [Flavobacteriales bacterium]
MAKTNCLKFLILLSSTVFTLQLYSQAKRFNVGGIFGLNFSELEGNGITDYYGINTGLIGTARLTKHSQLAMELLYSQNGEYVLPTYYPPIEYGRVRLNHIEIPVHFDILIGIFEREKFYDWHLQFGAAYTRLLNYSARDQGKVDVSDQIIYKNKEAMLLQAGTSYQFTKKLSVNFRASLPIRVNGLDWTLAARLCYMLD